MDLSTAPHWESWLPLGLWDEYTLVVRTGRLVDTNFGTRTRSIGNNRYSFVHLLDSTGSKF